MEEAETPYLNIIIIKGLKCRAASKHPFDIEQHSKVGITINASANGVGGKDSGGASQSVEKGYSNVHFAQLQCNHQNHNQLLYNPAARAPKLLHSSVAHPRHRIKQIQNCINET